MPSLTSNPSPNRQTAGKTSPTYSASITIDASTGQWHTITVTNTTAFTINAPTNPPSASQTGDLTIEVVNSVGGAMSQTITWNAIFKQSSAGVFPIGTWANPASTKKRFIRFQWNGVNWIAVAMSSADY